MQVGCPFQGDGTEICYESCALARLAGEDRVCANTEFDPANESKVCPHCHLEDGVHYIDCPIGA